MKYFLPKSSIKSINLAIEGLFARLKGMFLNKKQEPKKIRFSVTGVDKPLPQREDFSLPGIFDAAAKSEGGRANPQLKNALQSSVEQYLDAHQELAKAKVQSAIQAYLNDAELSADVPILDKVLGKQLNEVMGKVKEDVFGVLDSELNRAKNVSSLDSISRVSAAVGVDDPTVVFLGPNDANTCKDCKRLFFMPDGITPRAWKMSELKGGYGKHGDTRPSMSNAHPHCRHSIAPMMPGYGFKSGKIAYIEPGYDVLKEQRS
jgi:hypothetical protein